MFSCRSFSILNAFEKIGKNTYMLNIVFSEVMGTRQQLGPTDNAFSMPFIGAVTNSATGNSFERKRNDSHVGSDPDITITWRELLEEFSLNTTLHGIRHIVRSDAFIGRRYIQ